METRGVEKQVVLTLQRARVAEHPETRCEGGAAYSLPHPPEQLGPAQDQALARVRFRGVHVHALVRLHELEHHLDLRLDRGLEVLEHRAHVFLGLRRQVLLRELAKRENVRTADYAQEKLRVGNPKLSHVGCEGGVQVGKVVVQLRQDPLLQREVYVRPRIVLAKTEASRDVAQPCKRGSVVQETPLSVIHFPSCCLEAGCSLMLGKIPNSSSSFEQLVV